MYLFSDTSLFSDSSKSFCIYKGIIVQFAKSNLTDKGGFNSMSFKIIDDLPDYVLSELLSIQIDIVKLEAKLLWKTYVPELYIKDTRIFTSDTWNGNPVRIKISKIHNNYIWKGDEGR